MSSNQNQPMKDDQNTFMYQFKQQIMKAWQPVPTLKSTIILFSFLTFFFFLFGGILLGFSQSVVEVNQQYDNKCDIGNQNCEIQIKIEEKMTNPVFFYYELDNFYQNHRRYVKSRNVEQLKGEAVSIDDIQTDCDPVFLNKHLFTEQTQGKGLDPEQAAIPCGLIAKSIFTDFFTLKDSSNIEIPISDKGIAWPSDKSNKYKNFDLTKQWLNMEDERFMVWMRTAALPHFRKLWGKINQDIQPGTYKVIVNNKYDVSQFKGKKFFVLSTSNAFGGKNDFLAIAYLIVGVICLLITIFFIVKKIQKDKELNNKNK